LMGLIPDATSAAWAVPATIVWHFELVQPA
jgi:hypothetical protein